MNTFEDLDHALLTGVVLGSLRRVGIKTDVIVNETDDATPYLRVDFDGVQAVIVVIPQD